MLLRSDDTFPAYQPTIGSPRRSTAYHVDVSSTVGGIRSTPARRESCSSFTSRRLDRVHRRALPSAMGKVGGGFNPN